MKINNCFLIAMLLSMVSAKSFGQIENVLVETYYVSDANDATDTIGGFLEAGSKTYRVYLDLLPGSKLQKIYGDTFHLLKFSSTANFFNNLADGQTFGKDFSKNRLEENTVALDTWITIGQVTKPSGKIVGIPKIMDTDGSFVGGINNDGGSAVIPGGLLVNNDPLAGIPITTNDGNDTMTIGYLNNFGFTSANGDDSTIFGSLIPGSQFANSNCELFYSPVEGSEPDSNYILVAQLTTKGDIQFELNVEIVDAGGVVVKYVADGTVLLPGEVVNRILKYPYVAFCACPDINYMEYVADRDCDDMSLCVTPVKIGCMDTMACNYDPTSNVHSQSLCCYPGKCNDRDIEFVCPELISNKLIGAVTLFPNPTHDFLNVGFSNSFIERNGSIYNALSSKLIDFTIPALQSSPMQINVSELPKGIYLVRILNGNESQSITFIKD